eukprot:2069518-Karenia_brevis.AAC.1
MGNSLADAAARQGVELHPHDPDLYQRVKDSGACAKMVAKYIAAVGLRFAKDNHGHEKLSRAQRVQDEAGGLTGWSPGEHLQSYDARLQRWRCKRCLRSSAVRLSGKGCDKSWQDFGHSLCACGQYLFCNRCGAVTSKKVQGLLKKCPGHGGVSSGNKVRLGRLRIGRDPYSNEFIGDVIRWTEAILDGSTCGRPDILEEESLD